MAEIFLGLGTNLGNRLHNLLVAAHHIEEDIGQIVLRSSIYQTEPWGVRNQPEYYNQCLGIITMLNPFDLLKKAKSIERLIGREEDEKWASRVIDIDILYFGGNIINNRRLVVPHRHLHERRFALVPLAEIAPDFMHPKLNLTNMDMLVKSDDNSKVERLITEGDEVQLHSN
ncbi:MAG: 2-amino-4-hydroxy-6-hydroxymethyldihydropteridine diphosphokinase [Bacteroidetes bacterium]|nr:2-amino-4-hydroxy-6-hydroxymethyldihydropteridine diphosphokinase [Bacteroidota bacterium]